MSVYYSIKITYLKTKPNEPKNEPKFLHPIPINYMKTKDLKNIERYVLISRWKQRDKLVTAGDAVCSCVDLTGRSWPTRIRDLILRRGVN
jgi:hypothetical protein